MACLAWQPVQRRPRFSRARPPVVRRCLVQPCRCPSLPHQRRPPFRSVGRRPTPRRQAANRGNPLTRRPAAPLVLVRPPWASGTPCRPQHPRRASRQPRRWQPTQR
ncbi:MAG: hypothetical protein FJ276_18650 [Planctomycetes bacterium]|nr:hypothetical protein [Planctomycetota bacterium]